MTIDLLHGDALDAAVSPEIDRHLRLFASSVGAFLRDQRVDPEDLASMTVELIHSETVLPSRKEALVRLVLGDGQTFGDRYVGDPLSRPLVLDSLGRRRKERRAID